jgi:hypothetical protein
MSKDELAQLLGVQASQVDNLFDLADPCSYDLLQAAAKRLSERAALRVG